MEKRKGKRRNKKEKPYYPEQLAAANELNLDPVGDHAAIHRGVSFLELV